jgi:hypothetical protein
VTASQGGWLARSIIAGFVAVVLAAVVLFLAYVLAGTIGAALPGTLGLWFHNLTQNQITALVQGAVARALLIHTAIGIIVAVLYAGWVAPRLSGPGWRRGSLFALLPWVLSVVVVLPALGGGFLGFGLGAGPLPILGNLVVHLVYGATLGQLYGWEDRQATSVERSGGWSTLADRAVESAEGIGTMVGGLGGAIVAIVGALLVFRGGAPLSLAALAGLAFGAAVGLVVGSFVGLMRASEPDARS